MPTYKARDGSLHFIDSQEYIKLLPEGCIELSADSKYLAIVETQEQRIAAIKRERDTACVANVTALGRTWQADARSQQLLNAAITLAQAGLPLPTVWRDADNGDMPVTCLADLLAIAGAIAVQVQSAYAASWVAKAALP